VKRGEVWAFAGGAAYGAKLRLAIIVQDDRFDATDSMTVCPLTSTDTGIVLFRTAIEPSRENGLRVRSFAMADKIVTVPRTRLGHRIGRIAPADMAAVERAMLVFLGLAG
jgi:mRNA interferase MazF